MLSFKLKKVLMPCLGVCTHLNASNEVSPFKSNAIDWGGAVRGIGESRVTKGGECVLF